MTPPEGALPPAATGLRALRVVEKTRESSVITSFWLEAADGQPLPPFRAGQFLTLHLPVAEGTIRRNYSLSGPPDQGRYRITVKREGANGPGRPDGIGSSHLHDDIEAGDILQAQGPHGDFVLDESSERPVILLSGGVGLTPMVAMLHVLARSSAREVHFLHACENGDVHALRDEVRALVALRPGLRAHFRYRQPTVADRTAGIFDGEGLFTREAIRGLLNLDDYDVYLCGPPPFMQAVHAALRSLGVPKTRIAYEFFGPATVLEGVTTAPPPATAPAVSAPAPASTGSVTQVTFARSGLVADWDAAFPSLLDFAEAQGLDPAFSCRAGVCGTCTSRLVSGEVSYIEDPLDPPQEGQLLLCCTRPTSSVVLDL